MNWLDRAITWVSPEAGLRRVRARRAAEMVRLAYEGARATRRTDGWITTGNSANAEIVLALSKLRERSRDLVRNNPYAARAVAEVVGNAVGTGITAQARTGLPELNRQIDAAWLDWIERCDADGQLDFYGIQALVARTVFESGECLVRFRQRRDGDGFKVPVQLQVLEPDYLDQSKTQKTDTGYIIHGVEFDLVGRRTFYWLFGQHPGEVTQTSLRGSLVSARVPASEVLHIYRKDRPGQVRGVPWLAPVIITLRDLDEYEEAELVRKKIEACFAAFVTQPQGPEGPPIAPASTDAETGRRVESFEPGMIEYLKPGEEITFSTPSASSGYRDYVATRQSSIATGLQLTYEQLTGDLSRVNYSSYRAGLLSFRNGIESFRWLTFIPMLCIPVWNRFVAVAFTAGAIPQPGPFKAEWTPPGFGSVDPYKDSVATLNRIRTGTLTLRQAIAEQGYDPDAQLEQIAEINRLLDERGIVLDCDPRKVTQSGAGQKEAVKENNA
ncbi:MAG TPA: phage portal protein [Bryobacteraceae bacterium]|jgi:phage portal protein, lambda family|nr:phage portal protein [Bryobacteraceae bacterium]